MSENRVDGVREARLILSDEPMWVIVSELGFEEAIEGRPSLKQLQEAVGGYIENVTNFVNPTMRSELTDQRLFGRTIDSIYVNEEARIYGMTYNPFATAILGFHVAGPAVIVFHPRCD
jgi:hypothetical protein